MLGGSWLAQSLKHATLDPGVMSLSSMSGVEITKSNKKKKKNPARTLRGRLCLFNKEGLRRTGQARQRQHQELKQARVNKDRLKGD